MAEVTPFSNNLPALYPAKLPRPPMMPSKIIFKTFKSSPDNSVSIVLPADPPIAPPVTIIPSAIPPVPPVSSVRSTAAPAIVPAITPPATPAQNFFEPNSFP